MMVDDDEAFLYGDEDEPSVPTPLNGDAPEAAMSDGEPDEGDDSESDLEIILDGEGVAPIRKPLPVVAPKPAAPVEPATAPAPAATTEYVPQERPAVIGPAPASLAQVQTVQFPPSQSTKIESKPFEEPLASTSSSAGFLAPPEPPAAPAPAVSTVPSLDVDFAPKDVNGNDLFDTDIDALEDKAWRRPGANQADWFNYGMNEQAWKNYVAKQKRLRQTENLDNNPFAAFATGSVADAWQSLGPEMKAVMMATIMGYQPGNPGMMQGMMGGGQGFQGMPQMGYGMDMGAFNGGMGGEQMGYGNQIQQGFEGNGEAPEGGDGGEHDGAYGHGSARGGRGGGFANRGGRGGGGRGGGEARAPLPPRHQPPLPSNVPTGPRNRGAAPVAPRKERAYLDKDRGGQSASEGLDYGGGDSTHDKSPVNSRRSRDDEGRSSGNRRRSRDRSAESDDRARGSSSRANGGSSRRSGRGERSESKSVDIGSLTGLERIAAEEQARKIKKEAGEDDRDRGSRSPVRIRGAAGSEHGDGNDIVENDDDRRRRADDESDRRSRRRDEEDDRSGSRRKDHRSSRRSYDDEDDSSSRRHRDDSYDDSRKRKATEEVDERSRRKTSSRKDAMRYDDE